MHIELRKKDPNVEAICPIPQSKEDVQNKLLYGEVMAEAGSLHSTSASRA